MSLTYMTESTELLEKMLFDMYEQKTPDYIKNRKLINFDDKNEISFILRKEYLYPYDEFQNPEGLGLLDWFAEYEKEARVSTAGIRGPQNILYPTDTRFPINAIGIIIATLAKALVAKEKYPNKELHKLAACEVRYNSQLYLDLISRVQAALGITTHVPSHRDTIPIWMASFLVFKLDLLGGEYITSSHGISVKNATKDLNNQGSQYLPEESMAFIEKIKEIFSIVEETGSYEIKLAAEDSSYIDEHLMEQLNNGVDLYVDYLKNGVANAENLESIKSIQNRVIIENVGGSAYKTLSKVLMKLGISNEFQWFNKEESPFFHGIGKYSKDPDGRETFYDYSADATVVKQHRDGSVFMPVIETMNYEKKLKDKPIGTVVLITDPDHDRLTIVQVESKERANELSKLGIQYIPLNGTRLLAVYSANQAFLMIMDFWTKQLKAKGLFDNHPRFIIKTTASSMAWDEWAAKEGIKVVNVPVGFKEIAGIMKKVEKQISENPEKEVIIRDVFGEEINLGVNPRMIFGGEESGGMIIGAEELIRSISGRIAIAMREKSATEAIVVASALVGHIQKYDLNLADYLSELFSKNNIIARFDVREDISYYNESEPDIDKLKAAKREGEQRRIDNDLFYLSLAMAKRENLMSMNAVRNILNFTFPQLDFSNLEDIKFVGDGTYLKFSDKFIEIRPSGTDAKTKAYGGGHDRDEIVRYANALANYSGSRNDVYNKYIRDEYYNNVKEASLDTYQKWSDEGMPEENFVVPDYSQTLKY